MTGTVHVVGAGLAGLSAALVLAGRGAELRVHEGAPQAGGRCRSYHDARLGRTIDNGNHLVLSGNKGVQRYLTRAGAEGALVPAAEASFPFYDARSGERWAVRLNDGALPWWALRADRRPRGVTGRQMASAARILVTRRHATIAQATGATDHAHARFWEPMSLAVMNLPPDQASARLMRATALRAWRDGKLARPLFAPDGLGAALIDPALRALGDRLRVGALLKEVEREGGHAVALRFASGERVVLGAADRVILALPPHRLAALLPELDLPTDASAILNAHFVAPSAALPRLAEAPRLIGLTNAHAQWAFVKGDVVSLTVSASQDVGVGAVPGDELLPRLWDEARRALDLPPMEYDAARLVHEKRATFRQTPENVARRPKTRTLVKGLFLAGDMVDTGLPATIEGAVVSGEMAARAALGRARI